MKLAVVTLFPELVRAVAHCGVAGRAIEAGVASLETIDPRDFATDRHRTVDDRPYGGGPGMLMKFGPLSEALDEASRRVSVAGRARVVYLSPQGRRLDHEAVLRLAGEPALVLIAGRYEGIDERVVDSYVDEELSIGDFVLSGGELAAMVVIDAVLRQLPGTLGHDASAQQDSFADGLLDCPHYTRPEQVQGRGVPPVLLSGDHDRIRRWRLQQSLGRTLERRPELLETRALSAEERQLLNDYCREHGRALPACLAAQQWTRTGEQHEH